MVSRSVSLGAVHVLLLALTSCSFHRGPAILQRPPPAQPGAAYWSEVAASLEPQQPTTWSDISVSPSVLGFEAFRRRGTVGASIESWPIPGSGTRTVVEAAPSGDRVDARTTRGFNLGVNAPSQASGRVDDFPILPLWMASEELRATRGGPTETTASWSWNPFWVSSTVAPDADAWTRGFGVPLLYWGLDQVGPGREMRYRQTLWTLGPGWFTARDELTDSRSWMFLPVAAGGFGLIAWVSSVQESPNRRYVGHGPVGLLYIDHATRVHPPLFGALLLDAHVSEIDWFRERLLLAGALWAEQQAYDVDGNLLDSFHGPLFGAIAWGRGREGAYLELLWLLRIPL